MNANELREAAESVAWWLAPENAEARQELAERRPELGMWLSMIEARVDAELKRKAEQEEVRAKA